MKFTCTVDINQSIDKVLERFQDPEGLKEWQEGFERMEHVSGEPGTQGAVAKMHYKYRGKPMEITETIHVMNLPEEMTGLYEHKHMSNMMTNRFEKIDDNATRYTADIDYIKIKAFMPKLIFKLFPSLPKKQTQKWLDNFKDYVERS